jgi:hypothetical protein
MIIPLHSRDGDGISINSRASRWWWYGVDISWNREYIEFILVIREPCWFVSAIENIWTNSNTDIYYIV